MSKEEKEQHRRWQAEEDFRTLGRAAEIHGDEERKKAVIEMHEEHADMLKTLFSRHGEAHKADNMKSEDQSASGSKKAEAGHVTDKGKKGGGDKAKEKTTGKDAYYGRKRS
ncbi:hypothetical protein [Ralstonia insidiosa]|uniref:hypothetical protein n=1 Tax=Ralstonia insidiosa TaxID=190721 RepID=UPI000CEF4969|nr:hypothetical protein [Ralstonia insidiosa]